MNEDDMGDYQSKVHVDFERKFDLADGVYPLTVSRAKLLSPRSIATSF